MKNYIFDNDSIKQINELNRIMQPAFLEVIEQQNNIRKIMQPTFLEVIEQQNNIRKIMQPTFRKFIEQQNNIRKIIQPTFRKFIEQQNNIRKIMQPTFLEVIEQQNNIRKIMQPTFRKLIEQQNNIRKIMQPTFRKFIEQQNNLPFLNNRFAWIGAIENFQQVISNMALATDIVADKFALDFSREEILPLFKELDEKVVAGIIANGDNVDVPVQQCNLIEKLLKHENIIAWIQSCIMASCDLHIAIPVCLVMSLSLDCFKNKRKS